MFEYLKYLRQKVRSSLNWIDGDYRSWSPVTDCPCNRCELYTQLLNSGPRIGS